MDKKVKGYKNSFNFKIEDFYSIAEDAKQENIKRRNAIKDKEEELKRIKEA